ncbi:MAG: nitronate monooxygenase [Sphingobium sp.]|nr:nitronate monooxygenase [Sphingobium sp.]
MLVAPMAGFAGVDLAIAAGRAGTLAPIPCALLSIDQARDQVAQVRAAGAGPVNLNFFVHHMPETVDDGAWRETLAPYYAQWGVSPPDTPPVLRLPFSSASADLVEEVRPEVVSFHFGLPAPELQARVKATGAVIVASATTPHEARWLAERGVDAVIAQGAEAGGHASHFLDGGPATHMGLFALLPQIVDAVDVPVIAAGGISDARGVAAAFLLGASAVQIGTAFLTGPESLVTPMHRAAIAGEGAERTMFTTLFSGRAARGVENRLMRDLGPMHPSVPPFPYSSPAIAPLKAAAEAQGDTSFSSLWSGQAGRLARPMSAGERIAQLVTETEKLLSEAAQERI